MKYQYWILKRTIEHLFLLPFIIVGRVLFRLRKNEPSSFEVYFFFPFYHTGGAEYVHAQIIQALKKHKKGKIYFTRHSQNDQFKSLFENSGWEIQDISKWTDHKLWYFCNLIMRGYLSAKINLDPSAKWVFNGQSNFGYKISPWIKKSIPQIELIHSFNSFSWIRIPYIEYYHQTVMIARVRIQDHLDQYEKIHVPHKFAERIKFIQNGISIPDKIQFRDRNIENIRVLYVGRGSKEKRLSLIFQIAQQLEFSNIEFGFVGDITEYLPTKIPTNCKLYGNISDPKQLEEIYQQHDILLITSSTEGMPIVVQEAMANGLAIIGTPVGDIPYEIENGVNGFVLSSSDKENIVVEEAVNAILLLQKNRTELIEISNKNQQKAKQQYSFSTFQQNYERLFYHSSTN